MAKDFNLEKEYGDFLDILVDNLENPREEVLQHYGVLGMKWGVRKDRGSKKSESSRSNSSSGKTKLSYKEKAEKLRDDTLGPNEITRKTKNGETITISKTLPGRLAVFTTSRSDRIREGYTNGASFEIKDSSGKKVGDALIGAEGDTLELGWIGIDKGSRGKGYATAVLSAAEEFGRAEGFTKMTLEAVPREDARHIYTSLGFEPTKDGPAGLLGMEYVFDVKHMASEDLELFHYGVLGMKWGVRKDRKTKGARREKRAAKYDRRAESQQKKIDRLKGKEGNVLTRGTIKREIRNREGLKARNLSDAAKKREGKLSSGQKKTAIGAAIAGTIVAAYAANHLSETGDISRAIDRGKAHFDNREDKLGPWERDTQLYQNAGTDDVRKIKAIYADQVNPDFGERGTTMNCRRATFAFEARRRGYDVQATKTTKGAGQNSVGLYNALDWEDKYDGTGTITITKAVMDDIKKGGTGTPGFMDLQTNLPAGAKNKIENTTGNMSESIFESLSKEPNKSRGELGMMWSIGGGHSVAYEIVKGKPVIFDTQTGKMFSTPEEFSEYGNKIGTSGYTRLDNVPLNQDFLNKWVTNKK